ncbi:MAG: translation elongation factor Ts [Planctomycetales bacterium]|nr:translation elongation factor Ts [Planctomycetales bacterium]
MAEITAAQVKALRDKTQLPMMECKRALQETGGDQDAAFELLRKQGKKTMAARSSRETAFGRMAVHADVEAGVGAMIELQCESASVVGQDAFVQLANDLATQLATGPGAATAGELLAQPSPSQPGMTLAEQKDDLSNKIREVFNVSRITRVDKPCGGYAHHTGTLGVLVEVSGGPQALANEIAMHVAAMQPAVVSIEQLPADDVDKERGILRAAALEEGKPENIVDKMVEGRMRTYYEQRVLLEQPFVKEEKKKVGAIAKEAGMTVEGFESWKLGGE